MTTAYNPRLLIPPEQEEVYPYRRVWRSVATESIILLGVTLALFVLTAILGVAVPPALARPANVGLALLPLGLWLGFSLLAERFVPEPRRRLPTIVIITALAANAVGIPLVDGVFQVERWLPLAPALTRILGYAFTVGLVQEMIKYLVVRFTVWPDGFRTRLDSIAFGAAAAVGYTTVVNLHYALSSTSAPDVAAMRMFDTLALQVAGSIIVGYGLAEVRFGQPTPLLLTITLAGASLLTGVVVALRAGLVNAGLTLADAAATPIYGLALTAVVLLAVAAGVGFLIENADRQAREAAASRER